MFLPQVPQDGWTHFEKIILRDTLVSIYRKLSNPLDKFTLIAHLECGYSQIDIARMTGISQAAISKRLTRVIEKIRRLKRQRKL